MINLFLKISLHMIGMIEGTLVVDFMTGNNTILFKVNWEAEFYKKGQLPVSIIYQIISPFFIMQF